MSQGCEFPSHQLAQMAGGGGGSAVGGGDGNGDGGGDGSGEGGGGDGAASSSTSASVTGVIIRLGIPVAAARPPVKPAMLSSCTDCAAAPFARSFP